MPRKAILFAAAVSILCLASVGAQEGEPEGTPFTPQIRTNQRSMGDQTFAITAGLLFPLNTYLLNDWPSTGYEKGWTDSKLGVGGTGSLAYSFYLNGNIKLGLQLTGAFCRDINDNWLYSIPITVKGTYEFHPFGRISIPVHLALGMLMTSYDEYFVIDFILRPGLGVYFDWSYEWSFGLDLSYWFIPQTGTEFDYEKSIANMMDVTLTAEYHF